MGLFKRHLKKPIIGDIRETIEKYRSVVVSGEVGVGKITNTLEALHDVDNIYYIGNPVDHAGRPRPKGYDKYIDYITTLKKGLHIMTREKEILSFDFSSLSGDGAIVVIDEIYGRSAEEYEKIHATLKIENIKVILIAGCLKNIGPIIQDFDLIIMLTPDEILSVDKDFVKKITTILRPELPEGQAKLFH